MFKASCIAAGLVCAAIAFSAAASAEILTLKTDETTLIKLSQSPGTVVVGNPMIADATIENNTLFLVGRAFGSTNLMVLDKNGKQLGNYTVNVQMGGDSNLTVFAGGPRNSYTCAPLCEGSVQPGDDLAFANKMISVISDRAKLAGAAPEGSSSMTNGSFANNRGGFAN
jgi:Pilus formation protein N terminal region